MDFFFSTADNFRIFDDIDIKQEMEFLTKDDSNDMFSNLSIDKFDDIEMKLENDFEIKKDGNEEMDEYSPFSLGYNAIIKSNHQDIWNGKHVWDSSNNSILCNSNSHLDFIGGSPESALMVNPNIVIPDGRISYELSNREKENEEKIDIAKSEVRNILSNSSCVLNTQVTSPNTSSANSKVVHKKANDNVLKESRMKEVNLRVSTETQTSISSSKFSKVKSAIKGRSITKSRPQISVVRSKSVSLSDFTSKENVPMEISSVHNTDDIGPNYDNNSIYDIYFQQKILYPKPAFSYSCLITMALKNSKDGSLPVSEIYNFMCNHFPYFKTAPSGWKNSVRHNLSLNKCFEKIEKPPGCANKKGCLWALNPDKVGKMEDEVRKWTDKDRAGIKRSMVYPDHLELLEKGELNEDHEGKCSDDNEYDGDFDEEIDNADLSEIEELRDTKPSCSDILPLVNLSDMTDLSHFGAEVDNGLYEDLIGNITNDQLFSLSESIEDLLKVKANNKKKSEDAMISSKDKSQLKKNDVLQNQLMENVSSVQNIEITDNRPNVKISYIQNGEASQRVSGGVSFQLQTGDIIRPKQSGGVSVRLQNGGLSLQLQNGELNRKKLSNISKFDVKKSGNFLKINKGNVQAVDNTIKKECDNTNGTGAVASINHDNEDSSDNDEYDINQLLRFQNLSTRRQQYTAKYITVNKSGKLVKQNNSGISTKKSNTLNFPKEYNPMESLERGTASGTEYEFIFKDTPVLQRMEVMQEAQSIGAPAQSVGAPAQSVGAPEPSVAAPMAEDQRRSPDRRRNVRHRPSLHNRYRGAFRQRGRGERTEANEQMKQHSLALRDLGRALVDQGRIILRRNR